MMTFACLLEKPKVDFHAASKAKVSLEALCAFVVLQQRTNVASLGVESKWRRRGVGGKKGDLINESCLRGERRLFLLLYYYYMYTVRQHFCDIFFPATYPIYR